MHALMEKLSQLLNENKRSASSDLKQFNEAPTSPSKVITFSKYVVSKEDCRILEKYCKVGHERKNSANYIQPGYIQEAICEGVKTTRYYLPKERELFRITCEDGKFINHANERLHGAYIFDLFLDKRLYAAPVSMNEHHTHLSFALPLSAAGVMYFFNGTLITVSNESGHYRINRERMIKGLKEILRVSDSPCLLFEDHSDIIEDTPPFDNINFSKISLKNENLFEKLDESQLIKHLSDIYNKQLKSPNVLQTEPKEIVGCMNDCSPYAITPTYSNTTAYVSSIFKSPELTQLTCLARFKEAKMNGDLTSRFNGVSARSRTLTR